MNLEINALFIGDQKKLEKKKLNFFFKNGGMCEDCVPMFPPFWRVLDMGLASGHSSPYGPSLRQWLSGRSRAGPLLPLPPAPGAQRTPRQVHSRGGISHHTQLGEGTRILLPIHSIIGSIPTIDQDLPPSNECME